MTVYVDAGTALEMRHDGKIVTGFVNTPRRVTFVIISANSSVVPVEGNPADDIINDAVVRRYTILSRRIRANQVGAVVGTRVARDLGSGGWVAPMTTGFTWWASNARLRENPPAQPFA